MINIEIREDIIRLIKANQDYEETQEVNIDKQMED